MLKSILVGTSLLAASLMLGSCGEKAEKAQEPAAFVTIQGQDLIKPDGTKLFIMGTNLGNWLNPEGYMFKFSKTNSPRFINEMFCQLVGPDFTAEFWKAFKDNYITREDVQFIKNTGANTIRLPFHYKLFTDEDFMGLTANQDGFARVDSVVEWCREADLYLILVCTMLRADKREITLTTVTVIPGCLKVKPASSCIVTSGARLRSVIKMNR